MELFWENLLITAKVKASKKIQGKNVNVYEEKPLLHSISGVVKPGTFTAILGPSGTLNALLNFIKYLFKNIKDLVRQPC